MKQLALGGKVGRIKKSFLTNIGPNESLIIVNRFEAVWGLCRYNDTIFQAMAAGIRSIPIRGGVEFLSELPFLRVGLPRSLLEHSPEPQMGWWKGEGVEVSCPDPMFEGDTSHIL